MVLQLATQVVLARILGPVEFGLFALGVLVVGISTYFSDIGLAYALIQKKSVNANDIRFVWTWQCFLGLLVSGAIFFSAGLLAIFFAKPEAEFIFRWLSLVILINTADCSFDQPIKERTQLQIITDRTIVQLLSWICLCWHSVSSRGIWRRITGRFLGCSIGR